MRRRLAIASLLWAVVSGGSALARTWTSAAGTFKIDAELVEARPDGTLVLRRPDGATVEVKVDKLSPADQEFVRQQATNGGASQSASTLNPQEVATLARIKSATAKAAVQAYEQAEKTLGETYTGKQKEYREKLAGLLEEALKEATAAGNLDDALAIRNAIQALQAGAEPALADRKPPLSSPIKHAGEGDAAPRVLKPANLTLVVGSWKVTDVTLTNHLEVWTFNRDGTVQLATNGPPGNGLWRMEQNRVLVKWLHLPKGHDWNTFNFPLNRETVRGDSWTGAGVIRATKLRSK